MADNEFNNYLKIAKGLMGNLKDPEKRICGKWILKLVNIKSDDIIVKKNRNAFFKYLLHVLNSGNLEGPFHELPTKEELSTCPGIPSSYKKNMPSSLGHAYEWLQEEVFNQK